MLLHGLDHIVDEFLSPFRLGEKSEFVAELDIISSADNEESGNHK